MKLNSNLGKPLNYEYIREKKIGSKRIYFLVYKDICLILLVATSNKKTQQETIEDIKKYLDEYRKYVYRYIKN